MLKLSRSLSLIIALALLLVACGQAPAAPVATEAPAAGQPAAAQPLTFGASYFTLNNPHFLDWRDGLNAVFAPLGHTLINADAQLDINKQIADIEDMIQQGVSAIFIAPADSKAIKTALLSAQRANIPVFIMDVPVEDSDLVVSTIATDNVMAGRVLGEALVKDFGGKANVAIIDWPVVKAVTDRTDGFAAAVKDHPEIKVIARPDGKASVEGGLPAMENILQSNPEVQAVFSINDPSGMGALNALRAANRTDVKIYSVDGSQDGVRLTCDGAFAGTSAQFPLKMGSIAAETALRHLAGETVEKQILVESQWISADNCQQFLRGDTGAAAPAPAAGGAAGGALALCQPYTPTPLGAGSQAGADTFAYDGGDITIAYLPMGTEFNYHVALNVGIESITKAAEGDGIDSFMLSPYSGGDQAAQMGMLQDVTGRADVDAIILISFDEQALAPLVEEAVNAGKVVVIVNSDIADFPTPIHGVIGVNQFKVNRAMYDWARQQLGDAPRKVAVLEGEPGYLNDQRSGGFKDGLQGSNWDLVASVNGGWSVEKGNTAAMDVLQANPDVDVLFAANDYMAQGAALAAQELGRGDLTILGYDGDTNALEDIYRGAVTATSNTMPVVMGRQAACYVADILQGKISGGYVNTPTQIVYKENVKDVLARPADLYPTPSETILKELGVTP